MGTRVLSEIQYAREVTHGTPRGATHKLMAQLAVPGDIREWIIPGFGNGERVPGQLDSAYLRNALADGFVLSTPPDIGGLYYQLLPVILSSCIKGGLSPAEVNSGEGDYSWQFTNNLTAAETLETFTLEFGDDDQNYEIAYGLVPSFELTGNCDTGEVVLTAQIVGDDIVESAVTAGISAPTATYVIGGLFRVYADTAWANLGTTELPLALVDFRLSVNGGAHHKRTGSATRKPGSHDQGKNEVTLELGLEAVSAVETERGYYLGSTATTRCVRLEIDSGIAIGSGANHKITIDVAGIWTSWQPMGRELNGNNLEVATLTCGKDATGSNAYGITVITDLATIS